MSINSEKLVYFENVSLEYSSGNETNIVLENISMDMKRGEVVGLFGESGCGKSTIAYVLCGMKKISKGKLKFPSKKVQLVLQNPETSLDPLKTIGYSLREVLKNYNIEMNRKKLNRVELDSIIGEQLENFGIPKTRINDYPHQFSGGELQRICILKALIREPEVLVLDEATSMLDVLVQARIMKFLLELQKKLKLTYLIISHDKDMLKIICDKIYYIEEGNLLLLE